MNRLECIDFFELCNSLEPCSVDMILCDLPYGVTENKWDNVIPIPEMWQAFKRVIKARGAIVLTATQPFASDLIQSNRDMFKYEWIWVKTRVYDFINAKNKPMSKHESILIFSKGTTANHSNKRMSYYPQDLEYAPRLRKRNKSAFRIRGNITPRPSHKDTFIIEYNNYPTSILNFANPNNDTVHPTQKPLDLWQYLIKTYTQEGDTVLDPCVGSGTTAVACHLLDRHYICGDISPEYIQIAHERLLSTNPFRLKVVGEYQQPSLFNEDEQ